MPGPLDLREGPVLSSVVHYNKRATGQIRVCRSPVEAPEPAVLEDLRPWLAEELLYLPIPVPYHRASSLFLM